MTRTQQAAQLLQNLVSIFSQEKLPEICAKTFIKAPEIPSSSWSLGNQLLMIFSGTTDARGYNQWRQVYRNVKKGSKAIYILVPMQKKIKEQDTDESKMITFGFKAMPVFRYEDTEGVPLKEYEPKVLPPLFDLAKKNGIRVRWKNSSFGEYGSIDVKSGSMTISTDSPDTFLHELVHWYDNLNHPLKPGQDAQQETVAQLGACVLAKMYGYDVQNYTWQYIANYADTDSPQKVGQACMKVLARVQKIINAILQDAQTCLKQTDVINVRK
jgi:hypothetical protein